MEATPPAAQNMTVMPQQMAGMTGRPIAIMPFMDAMKTCFNKYADFDGRASRSEYWWFTLGLGLLSLPFSVLDFALFLAFDWPAVFGTLFNLAVFVPTLSVTWRRFHDSGKSGMNMLWVLTIIGAFYVFYLTLVDGDAAPNQYGAVPTNTL